MESLATAGRVAAVRGAIVDVDFEPGNLTAINSALIVEWDRAEPLILEVHTHVDAMTVRSIALQATAGLALARTQMPPEQRRDDPNRIEEPPAHAKKSNLQCKPKVEFGPPPFLDDPGLFSRERKKHLNLEGSYLARQMPLAEECRVASCPSCPPICRHDKPPQIGISKSLIALSE